MPYADDAFSGGFAAPVFEAQTCFRAVMDALARPALPVRLITAARAPEPMPPLLASIALTLADGDSTVWLDGPLSQSALLKQWFAFHCGAPLVEKPNEAAFAFIVDPAGMPALSDFAQGSDTYPDRSTTLIIAVDRFDPAKGPLFTGPGFETPRRLGLETGIADFAAQITANRALFPRGVDLVFAGPDAIVGLPRSSKLMAEA